MVATGGAGHVYIKYHEPKIATRRRMAFVHRARGKVSNMQYIQFHLLQCIQNETEVSF